MVAAAAQKETHFHREAGDAMLGRERATTQEIRRNRPFQNFPNLLLRNSLIRKKMTFWQLFFFREKKSWQNSIQKTELLFKKSLLLVNSEKTALFKSYLLIFLFHFLFLTCFLTHWIWNMNTIAASSLSSECNPVPKDLILKYVCFVPQWSSWLMRPECVGSAEIFLTRHLSNSWKGGMFMLMILSAHPSVCFSPCYALHDFTQSLMVTSLLSIIFNIIHNYLLSFCQYLCRLDSEIYMKVILWWIFNLLRVMFDLVVLVL